MLHGYQRIPSISVLVIEIGKDDHADPRVNDVRKYGQAFNTELDHSIHSTPIEWQGNESLLLVAGKTLGGSGSINGASWTKGPKTQYDVLPLLTGDNSWGWEGLQQYMLKAENFHVPESDEIADGAQWINSAHARGGPVQVSFAEGLFGGIQQPALEASQKVWSGMQRIKDAASGLANGATIIPNMVASDDSQNRSSPFTAYAQHQVQERANFVILTGHRVTEILWSDNSTSSKDGLTASGVRFQACATCPSYEGQRRTGSPPRSRLPAVATDPGALGRRRPCGPLSRGRGIQTRCSRRGQKHARADEEHAHPYTAEH